MLTLVSVTTTRGDCRYNSLRTGGGMTLGVREGSRVTGATPPTGSRVRVRKKQSFFDSIDTRKSTDIYE